MGSSSRFLLFLVLLTSGCVSSSSEDVVIKEVIDGDTVDIIYANGTEETVRFIGMDTPEVSGTNSPEEFDIEATEENRQCLREYGNRATDFVSEFEGEEIELMQDSVQRKRGSYGRLLAYIYVDNRSRSLNQMLIDQGLARVYYTEFSQRNSFLESERTARQRKEGLWNCS